MDEEEILERHYQVRAYLDHARQSLAAAAFNLEHGFYDIALNRAYYAVFYAASGLLLSRGISRSKHAGVVAAFRERFVRPGLIEVEFSDLYGDVMDARIDSDYEMTFQADEHTARGRLDDAGRFVDRVIRYLSEAEEFQI